MASIGEGMSLKEIDKAIAKRKREIEKAQEGITTLKSEIRSVRKVLKLWEKARAEKVAEQNNKKGDN